MGRRRIAAASHHSDLRVIGTADFEKDPQLFQRLKQFSLYVVVKSF